MAVELIARMPACLAEGLGMRATARVFEVDPNTVLHWLVEAAEHLRGIQSAACSGLVFRRRMRGAERCCNASKPVTVTAEDGSCRCRASPRQSLLA